MIQTEKQAESLQQVIPTLFFMIDHIQKMKQIKNQTE
jgi:hypothetical protein